MSAERVAEARPALANVSHPAWAPGLRLVWLHATSRRVPAALGALAACAIGLRIALIWHWNASGALLLPLIIEAAAVCVVAVSTASPLGEPERVAGRWLPWLRLGGALALTAFAVGALAAGALGGHLSGGTLDVLRNVAGVTGIGFLCAAFLGGGLAWTGPTAYLIAGVYGVYTPWHSSAVTTPWLWPARPPHDVGAALCAGLVFACGLAVFTVRGARDPAGE
jgi:hypothetical protein